MKRYRDYFKSENTDVEYGKKPEFLQKDENGYVHVAMTTKIFGDANNNLLATNSMYSDLLNDITPCIAPYSTKEKIQLDIFDTHKVDDLTVQIVTNGFKKYVYARLFGLQRQCKSKFFLFLTLFLIGLTTEILLYTLFFDFNGIPAWLFKALEVFANLFIWQFGGYIAFDFFSERKKIDRYKQILNLKFNIKNWD